MSSDHLRSYFIYALRRALRPIVRMLMLAGIRFDEFAELARGVYVETAIRDGSSSQTSTRERIALITGLTCHQVDNYIDNEGVLPLANPTATALAIEVLQKWHSTPEYVGPYGIPLELEFDTPPGRCMRSLVALVMPEADPRIALEELLHTGAVVPSGEKHFRAVSRSLVMPNPGSPQVIEHVGRMLARLGATLEYNMDPQHPNSRLERRVTADRGVPLDLVPEFEKYARGRAVDFLVELDNWLAPYASEEVDGPERVDTGVSVFLYVEPRVPESSLTSLLAPTEPATNLK